MEGKGHQSMMDDLIREISRLAREEYQRAAAEHGGAANTPHEGYALIKEEEEEAADQMSTVIQKAKTLWWSVKSDNLGTQRQCLDEIRIAAILGACELVQVAAMADKALEGLKKLMGGGETR